MTTPKSYPHIGRKEHELDAAHWEECYRKGETPWDHGGPSPGLVDFLENERYTPGKVLVPGCGVGHDCMTLARHGFDVTGVDVSRLALQKAADLASRNALAVDYVRTDCLHPRPEWLGAFDWVFEHTCFCAIDPENRGRYVDAMSSVLRGGGHLLGIFFHIQPETGPPFGTTREELRDRFGSHFTLMMEKVPPSFPNRKNEELLLLWRKKA